MAAVKQGDQNAFAALVHRHIDALYNYAFRLLRSPTGADDLVQETWLAAWHKARSYKPGQVKLTTWLHRILHNKYVDQQRRDRLVFDDTVLAAQPDPATPGATVEQAQQLAQLNDAIDTLPQQQKVALLLNTSQGMNHQDIATIMGLSVRAVESSLARARRALKQKLQHLSGSTAITGTHQ